MDSFEWNKIFAALLTVAFVVMGASIMSEVIFHTAAPEKAGFAIAGGETHSDDKKTDAGPTVEPVAELLASADLAKGEKVAKKCAACHNFAKGAGKKTGPALYDIVNRQIGGSEGFGYSSAMKTYGDGKTWTYDELNKFIYKPKAHIKGTSMGFAGIKKTADRAALIGYLRSLSDSPAALPGS